MGRLVQISSRVLPLLLLLVYSPFGWTLPQADDPFQDETDQCVISVSPDVLASMSGSLRTDLKCDGLWSNLLQRFHYTHANLTACLERANTDATPEPTSSFCQLLLDDAQRQLEQEHRHHSAGIEEKLHTAQQEARKQLEEKEALQSQLNRLLGDRNELYLELLLAYIAIGDTPQAIKYYQLYPSSTSADKLHAQIVRSVYRVAKYQDQWLLNLVQFVRALSATETKLDLYRRIKVEILKRPSQRDSSVAAVVALSIKAEAAVHAKDPKLYEETIKAVEKRWKDQLYNGNFQEVVQFARRQPKFYEQLQTALATIDASRWVQVNFDRFVSYPNSLPQAEQRLAAFQQIMNQIRERNKNNSHKHLVQLAKQLDIYETFLTKTKADRKHMQQLEELRKKFPEFSRKTYGEYLREAKGDTMVLKSSIFLLGLALLFARATACQLDTTQDMLQRLLKTSAQGCETLWQNVQTLVIATGQNLTECERLENGSGVVGPTDASCRTQLEAAKRQAKETRKQIATDLEAKLAVEKQEGVKVRSAIASIKAEQTKVTMEMKGLYHSLLLLYIDIGSLRRALKYYHRLRALKEPRLESAMVNFTFGSYRYETQRLENLLTVVRHLPTAADKLVLYRLIQPKIMAKDPKGLPTEMMVAALDMGQLVRGVKNAGNDRQMYDHLHERILRRFKYLILAGNFREVAHFARKYPTYYDQIGPSVATVVPNLWPAINFNQYVGFPNTLPKATHRLRALLEIMKQIKQRNKKNFHDRLVALAKQVDICEQFMRDQKGDLSGADDLVKLKRQFADPDSTKSYEYYLQQQVKRIQQRPPVSVQRKNAQKKKAQGGRVGRPIG
uniref:Uncharacterized protein n=1 Tax=Anopheles farauti TaxID=69004 RepID=A0A182QV89_9DIPT